LVTPLFHHQLDSVPKPGEVISLRGAEAKHAIAVRRMRVGEPIQLANGAGLRVIGAISFIDDAKGEQSLTLTAQTVVQEDSPSPALVLIQALAKGDRDELAIQAATELGASVVVPWQADRSVSRWEGSKVTKGVERWQSIVGEAAKQALRAFTPEVAQPVTSKQLMASFTNYSRVLVLDPTATVSVSTVELPNQGSIAILVGPEGGMTDHELESFQSCGAHRVHLGDSILRTSTAGMAAISVLQSRLGAWS